MNRWDCDEPGCDAHVVGEGAGASLAAIGWRFRPGVDATVAGGPKCLCPAHRTDVVPIPCIEEGNEGKPCKPCAVRKQVARYLTAMQAADALEKFGQVLNASSKQERT